MPALLERINPGEGQPRRNSAWRLCSGVAALSFVLTGCHGQPPAPPHQALTFALGTNIAFVEGLLEHYRQTLPDISVTPKTTYGAYVVTANLQAGLGDIGIAQADAVYLSYRRGSSSNPRPHTELRGMAVLGINAVQVLTRSDSPIRQVKDLKGKRVGMLEPGTSSEVVSRIVLEAFGLTYQHLQPVFLRAQAGIDQLGDKTIDALIVAAQIVDLSDRLNRAKVKVISLDPATIGQLEMRYPFLRSIDIPSTELWGQANGVQTVGADALLICRKELSDDLVYRLTRELFVALPSLAARYPQAAAIDPWLAATTPIPLHPGAARYYRERELLK